MKLFKTSAGNILESDSKFYLIKEKWDSLINREDLFKYLDSQVNNSIELAEEKATSALSDSIEAPIGNQEVWAAGVTYLRSRDARMEESKDAGGADFYSKVYNAERPELFFKALPHRVAAPGAEVLIRRDSKWNVPEPELTLFINSSGKNTRLYGR